MKSIYEKDYNIVSKVEINNKEMFIVDLGKAMYVDGLMTRYVICSPSQFDKSSHLANRVEVVDAT